MRHESIERKKWLENSSHRKGAAMAVGWSNPGDRGGAQCVEMVNRSHRSEGGLVSALERRESLA
jgi:hypothetical protein